MSLGLDEAILISTIVGAILFGLFTALFGASIYILLLRRRREASRIWPIVLVSVLMYLVAAMHIVVSSVRAVNGLIWRRDAPGGPAGYFNITANSSYLMQDALTAIQTVLGDGFLIYRMYVVCGRLKIILVPAIGFWLATIAAYIGTFVSEARASPSTPVFKLEGWIASFFALTLFTNLTCTVLIAFRIWWFERRMPNNIRTINLAPVVTAIFESGLIYSATLITVLATFICGDWSQYIVLYMLVQIIGITFCLIIVRIGLETSPEDTSTDAQRSPIPLADMEDVGNPPFGVRLHV